jgi:hypothetical protein
VLGIGTPLDTSHLRTDALARTVAADCADWLAIDFHQHGVADVGTEGLLNRLKIRAMPAAGELQEVGKAER